MKRYGYWVIVGLLCFGVIAHAQEQEIEDHVQAATAFLQQKTGKAPQPQEEDGILYALEVQDLNLEDTELVTLSACDTGVGTLDYSEGVYGLVRAFHTAGARNVLMSLWPLGDRSAREFMARFYRTWLNGPKPKDLAVALRDTQLSFIKDNNEPLRNPEVWAPFVLVEGP